MRRLYGASPLHLLGHFAVLALSAYALAQALAGPTASHVVLWLVGAVLFHDALLWPLYSGADKIATLGLGRLVNYVRIPLGLSLLLLLAFFPVIASKGASNYTRVAGIEWTGYAARWLIVSAGLFAVSAGVYLVRRFASGGSKS